MKEFVTLVKKSGTDLLPDITKSSLSTKPLPKPALTEIIS